MLNPFNKCYSYEEISNILHEIKEFISNKHFNINENFLFITKKKNRDFLLDESLDSTDVIEAIKATSPDDYIGSKLDDKDIEPLYLHEFAIIYNNVKYVYMKFKFDKINKIIKVVSFHKNEYNVNFIFNN